MGTNDFYHFKNEDDDEEIHIRISKIAYIEYDGSTYDGERLDIQLDDIGETSWTLRGRTARNVYAELSALL